MPAGKPPTSQSEFGPDYLLIFVGYSSDGAAAADTIVSLEQELQRELDKLKRVNRSAPYNKVKIWKWESEAASLIGGQSVVISPHLERADIAVFVFSERVGTVAWQELNEARNKRPPIPILPFFPASPPSGDRMMDASVAEQWADLIRKRRTLAEKWTEPDSAAITPLPQYKDDASLGRLAAERITNEIVRLVGAHSDKVADQLGDEYRNDRGAEHSKDTLLLGKQKSSASKGATVQPTILGAGNILSVSPAGAGRYAATVVPTLASYRGMALVLDPSGRIYDSTAAARERFGPIVKLDPWGLLTPDARGVGSLNPIDIIKSLGLSVNDGARMLAEIIVPYRVYRYRRKERVLSDPLWPNLERKFLIGLIILAANSMPDGKGVFSEIRRILLESDPVYNLAVKIDASDKAKKEGDITKTIDPEAYAEISSFLALADTTRSGVMAGVSQHLGAFGSARVQRASDSSSFDVERWARGEPMTIYIVAPPPGAAALDSLYRLWMGALQLPLIYRPTSIDQPAMIVLDVTESFEVWPGLHTAISQRHDCQVWTIVSDLSDLDWAFEEFAPSILNSFGALQALRPKNMSAAERLSQLIGMPAKEIMEIGLDELLVVVDGAAPTRLTRLDQS